MNLLEVNNIYTHNSSIAQSADRVLQVSDGVLTDLGRCRE